MPSELARRRPDIAAAEALLNAAAARVGVAEANFYPQISLSAQAGTLASQAGDLFGPGSAFYLLGVSLAQPLFRGGELQARRRGAQAAYEQAGAAYREVVLHGFQEVADALRALEGDTRRLREHAEATDQARIAQGIADARFRTGGVSEYALLGTRRKFEEARLQLTQAAADRAADTAALLQALGGGWWAPGEPPR
jgi:outer membrane protein TolC